jgi:dTDP-4-dehydrorhamnose 3,5-epimerase
MPFAFEKTTLNGLFIVKPRLFGDERGFFMETFTKKDFEEARIKMDIIQINHSRSSKGVLRGLHFQRNPHEQAKLVRCLRGEILDVAVDIRAGSKTYGKYYSINLSESNRYMLYVPRGFAHGFLALSDLVEVEYAVDNSYAPSHEGGIIWNDPELGIRWPIDNPLLSEKDKKWPTLRELKNNHQSPLKHV